MNYNYFFFFILMAFAPSSRAMESTCTQSCTTAALQERYDLTDLPLFIQRKIKHMIFDSAPGNEWVNWLIERNVEKNLKKSFSMATESDLDDDNTTFKITHFDNAFQKGHYDSLKDFIPQENKIDCAPSYITFRFRNHHVLQQCDKNNIKIIKENGKQFDLVVPEEINIKETVDSAESTDGKYFAIASHHGFALFDLTSCKHLYTSHNANIKIERIVGFNHDSQTLVIRTVKNQLIVYDWKQNDYSHLLFNGWQYLKVKCIAFPTYYTLICEKQSNLHLFSNFYEVDEYTIKDIYPLIASLQPDQIRLLILIHKAFVANEKNNEISTKHEIHKIDLTKKNAAIAHARSAFLTLPCEIRRLVSDYVKLPLLLTTKNKIKCIFS